jgi:hypothetical protein
MPHLLAALTVWSGYACGFSDLFKASGPRDVRFVTGDTVVMRGQAILFRVELWVDGAPASSPTVRIVIPDSTRIRFNASRDSINGLQVGFGDVDAWIESSLAPRVDTTFRVRVRP